jgi:hypothetical protein
MSSAGPAVPCVEPAPPRLAAADDGCCDVDFDIHGLAGVRLCDASERDAAVVARQLGPLQGRLEHAPDIVVRFVDRLHEATPLLLVGHDDAGSDGQDFLLLRGRHKTRSRAVVPLDRLGAGFEIVCERGAAAVPLLVPILNLAVLSKGVLPLHASAFVHDGVGVVVTGWSKGGKTEALLGFAQRGARYVGDEWVYVTEDAGVCGIPEPVRVWDWHLRSAPSYRRRLTARERLRLRAIAGARATARVLPAGDGFRSRWQALLARQAGLDVAPHRLFGPDAVAPRGSFDVLFLAASHDASDIRVEPIDPLEVGRRMAFSLQHERRQLHEAYQKFRFAFPWSASAALERADEMERKLLRRAFAGKPAFLVRHPYPVALDALAEAMSDYCRHA